MLAGVREDEAPYVPACRPYRKRFRYQYRRHAFLTCSARSIFRFGSSKRCSEERTVTVYEPDRTEWSTGFRRRR